MEDFLKRLQGADAATKRRIVIISSVLAMVVVLYIWLAYFNNLLADAGRSDGSTGGQGETHASFWETMQRGTVIVYENVTGAVGRFGEMLKGPREYIVKPLK